MLVKTVAWTGYPGKDVAKLLAFYRDVMKMRVDRAHPSEAEAEFVEFDLGNDHWFTLLPEEHIGMKAGTGGGIVFEVDDIDAMLAAVRPHATSADEAVTDYPSCRIASFKDPEGNTVGLHQMKT